MSESQSSSSDSTGPVIIAIVCTFIVTAIGLPILSSLGSKEAVAEEPAPKKTTKVVEPVPGDGYKSDGSYPPASKYFVGDQLQKLEFVVLRSNRDGQVAILGSRMEEAQLLEDVSCWVFVDANGQERVLPAGQDTNNAQLKTKTRTVTVNRRKLYGLQLPAWSITYASGQRVRASSLPVGDTPAVLLRGDSALSDFHRRLLNPRSFVVVVPREQVPSSDPESLVP